MRSTGPSSAISEVLRKTKSSCNQKRLIGASCLRPPLRPSLMWQKTSPPRGSKAQLHQHCTHCWETKTRAGGGAEERRVQISDLIKQKGKRDLRGQTCRCQTLWEFTGRRRRRWGRCHLHHSYHFISWLKYACCPAKFSEQYCLMLIISWARCMRYQVLSPKKCAHL